MLCLIGKRTNPRFWDSASCYGLFLLCASGFYWHIVKPGYLRSTHFFVKLLPASQGFSIFPVTFSFFFLDFPTYLFSLFCLSVWFGVIKVITNEEATFHMLSLCLLCCCGAFVHLHGLLKGEETRCKGKENVLFLPENLQWFIYHPSGQ